MKRITQEELDKAISEHEKWLKGEGGQRLNFSGCNLLGLNLIGADLSGANLSGAILNEAFLIGADLSGASLNEADLSEANLNKSVLNKASLNKASLNEADLSGANLSGASLNGAKLNKVSLNEADLSGANLIGAKRWDKKIKASAKWSNLYRYKVEAMLTDDNQVMIRLGCHTQTLEEWSKDFFNNDDEFPNDGSAKTKHRINAFQFAVNYARIEGWIKEDKQ
jgi:uncharacterized protein YjbI with pentapeptide repeats